MNQASKVLTLVCAGTFLTALDVTIVNVAYRTIRGEFADTTALPWIISGYGIAFAASLLTAGRLADSFGRKRAFLTGMSVFAASSMLCGLAPNVWVLIAARVVQALGAALIVPSGMALVMPEFAVERRASAVGIAAAAGGLGAATGPVIGGLLVDSLGWRWIFFVKVPVCVVGVLVGRRLLRESRHSGPARIPDLVGAAAALCSVALLTLALVQSASWGWSSTWLRASVAGAVVLGVWFVRRTATHTAPVVDLGLFRLRFVSAANVAGILYAAGFYSFNFSMVQWLRDVWHYSPSRSGLAAIGTPIASMVVSPFGGRLAQRYGHNRVAVPGMLLLGFAGWAMAEFVDASPNYWTVFFPCLVVVGVAIGLSIGVLSSAASAYLPTHQFAMGSAIYATGRQVGGALGIAVVSAITASADVPVDGYRWSWRYVTCTMFGAALAMGLLFRRPTERELRASN